MKGSENNVESFLNVGGVVKKQYIHMQAVILVAGKGTRMRGLTEMIPKPMLSICGEPILAHKLRHLPEVIDEVVLVTGYLAEVVEDYFGTEWEGRRIVTVRQSALDGTGGALRQVASVLRDWFLVLMGDDLYHPDDVHSLISGGPAVLGMETDRAAYFGLLKPDTLGNITSIIERPHHHTSGLVNTGAYFLDRAALELPLVAIGNGEYGLPQTLAAAHEIYPVHVFRAKAWLPIGAPEDLPLAEQFLLTHGLV